MADPGEHGQYSSLNPEPIEIIQQWHLTYLEGNILKYLARHRRKGGKEDLNKAIWYLQRLIKEEYPDDVDKGL